MRESKNGGLNQNSLINLKVAISHELGHGRVGVVSIYLGRWQYQFRIEPDVGATVIAATPFGLHALQKIAFNLHTNASLPMRDQRWNRFMQQRTLPALINGFALGSIGAGAHRQGDVTVSDIAMTAKSASLIPAPRGYANWLADLKGRIHTAQQRAVLAVSTRNW